MAKQSCFIHQFKGLRFPNTFPENSLLWKKMGWISIPVGLSSFGMCGGLAATALDLFYHSSLAVPERTTPPSTTDGALLFKWLKQRQADSITLRDLWKYFKLMFSGKKVDVAEVRQAWKEIKADLEKERPVVIGLERQKVEKFYKVHQLAGIVKNHQVVVWGFEEEEGAVTLHLYDPRIPQENATLTFDPNAEDLNLRWDPPEIGPIYAFFKTSYVRKIPPLGLES